MSRLKLSVEQIIAAVEALDEAEQAEVRERLRRWFAGLERLGGDTESAEYPAASFEDDLGFSRRQPRFAAWEDPTITEELELFDALMAFGEE